MNDKEYGPATPIGYAQNQPAGSPQQVGNQQAILGGMLRSTKSGNLGISTDGIPFQDPNDLKSTQAPQAHQPQPMLFGTTDSYRADITNLGNEISNSKTNDAMFNYGEYLQTLQPTQTTNDFKQSDIITNRQSQLQSERQAAIESINANYETEKRKKEERQAKDTGTLSTGLARIGGYLGQSASELGVLGSLQRDQQNELDVLRQQREDAINRATVAYNNSDFELAKMAMQEKKDFESAIQEKQKEYTAKIFDYIKEDRAQREFQQKQDFELYKQNYAEQQDTIKNQQNALKFAADYGIDTPFFMSGNQIIDTATGMPTTLAAFKKATGQVGVPNDQLDFSAIEQNIISPEERKSQLEMQKFAENTRQFGLEYALKQQQYDLDVQKAEMAMLEQKAKNSGVLTSTKDKLDYALNIQGKLQQNPVVKNYEEVRGHFNALEGVMANVNNTDTQIQKFNDDALVMLFNKITDPGSVVREPEFERAAGGAPLIEKWKAKVTKWQKGNILSQDTRQALVNTAQSMLNAYQKSYMEEVRQAQETAASAGVNPYDVKQITISDYIQGSNDNAMKVGKWRSNGLTEKEITDVINAIPAYEAALNGTGFIRGQQPGFGVPSPKINKATEGISFTEKGGNFTQAIQEKYPDNSPGGQCGTFAHQLVDFPPVGDGKNQKIASVNKFGLPKEQWLQSGVQIGDVIITNENPTYGHVAVVNDILPDGRIKLSESNYKRSETVSHDRLLDPNSPKIYGAIRGKSKVG